MVACEYLDEGWVCVFAFDSFESDVLSKDEVQIDSLKLLTDGAWVWPNIASYYVEFHGLQVPQAFVAHMRENEWKVPDLSDQQLDEIVDALPGRKLDEAFFDSLLDDTE